MANISTVDVTAGVPTAGSGTVYTLNGIIDPTNAPVATKAASTAPVAADKALVVAISPNGQNANLNVDPNTGVSGHFGAPTVPLDYYSQYELVAASTTAKMGATGAQYDYLAGVLIIPANTSPGAVQVQDGNGTAITIFTGGASSVTDLKPFVVPLGWYALVGTSGGWNVITNSNVSAVGTGKFT